MLFGETDGVWFITTYLEKGRPALSLAIPPAKGYNDGNYLDLELIPLVRGTEAGPGLGAGGGTGGAPQALRQRRHEDRHVLLAPGPGDGPGGPHPGLYLRGAHHRGGRRVHDAHPPQQGHAPAPVHRL